MPGLLTYRSALARRVAPTQPAQMGIRYPRKWVQNGQPGRLLHASAIDASGQAQLLDPGRGPYATHNYVGGGLIR